MNGSDHLSSPSYVPKLLGSESPGASLLATLSGHGGPATELVDPIAALEEARAAQSIQVARTAREPGVKRDIDQFTRALATAKTPEEFLAAPGALKVLLVASGMGDQAGNREPAAQVLLSDPAETPAPIDERAQPRWSDLREACSFAETGLATLNRPIVIEGIANRYAEAVWRTNLVQKTPGLSNALDFLTRAHVINSVAQIAGDPTFRRVVTTALGIPEPTLLAGPEETIGSQVDLTKFQDRSFVEELTHRYLLAARSSDSPVADTPWANSTTEASPMSGLVV